MVEGIERAFPRLLGAEWRLSSQPDDLYNCIAWAAESTSVWWWPAGQDKTFWPVGVPRALTLEAFREAFSTLAYVDCASDELEPGFQKIALYANDQGVPTHAARQLESGVWTSKLGRMADIEHELRGLEGVLYGAIAVVMKRPLLSAELLPPPNSGPMGSSGS